MAEPRADSTTDVEEAAFSGMVAGICAAQRAGEVDPAIPPADLFAYVLGLLQSWAFPSDSFSVALDDAEAGRRARCSIRTAVERLIAAAGEPPS